MSLETTFTLPMLAYRINQFRDSNTNNDRTDVIGCSLELIIFFNHACRLREFWASFKSRKVFILKNDRHFYNTLVQRSHSCISRYSSIPGDCDGTNCLAPYKL